MSKIQWTDETWNVITGCTQISPACQNCYAKAMTKRLQGMAIKEAWAKIKCEKCERGMLNDDRNGVIEHFCECEPRMLKFEAPKYYYGWDKVIFHTDMLGHIFDKSKYPSGSKVFVNSMSDTFHHEVSYSHLKMLFNVMGARSDVTFQVLTKREMRMYAFLTEHSELLTPNIWIGVTAENQEMVDKRIDWLVYTKKEIKRFANKDIKIFVSCEPLLEAIDLSKYINELDWVIVGGERTNKKGRVMQFEWVERIYLQCRQSDTPFFFKQWGDGEAEAKAEIKGDDITLVEVIEAKKEFPKEI